VGGTGVGNYPSQMIVLGNSSVRQDLLVNACLVCGEQDYRHVRKSPTWLQTD
jgi:hypothetical protein